MEKALTLDRFRSSFFPKILFDDVYFNLGIENGDAIEIHEEWDYRMRHRYYDPVERLPDKIEEFFETLDRVRNMMLRN